MQILRSLTVRAILVFMFDNKPLSSIIVVIISYNIRFAHLHGNFVIAKNCEPDNCRLTPPSLCLIRHILYFYIGFCDTIDSVFIEVYLS